MRLYIYVVLYLLYFYCVCVVNFITLFLVMLYLLKYNLCSAYW